MTTAWAIRDYVVKNSSPNKRIRLLLIGHSQGGTIARILQLVVADKKGLPSDLPRKCWPYDTLSKSIAGIVGMGSPLSKSGSCDGFPGKPIDNIFNGERLYTDNGSGFDAGKVLMIGATPREEVYLPAWTPTINNECATNIKSKDSIRVNIYSLGHPTSIQSVIAGKPFPGFATLITKGLHNLKRGESFTITGAKQGYWNKTWKVAQVIGTSQREIIFQIGLFGLGLSASDSPALPKSTSSKRTCDVDPSTQIEDLCLVHNQVQSHGWWVEGGGICPASIVKPGRGDGNAPTPFCGFVEIVNNSTSIWPTAFTPIYDLTSAGNPGTVYDLIASKTRSWLP
jgi:hypothetical protein